MKRWQGRVFQAKSKHEQKLRARGLEEGDIWYGKHKVREVVTEVERQGWIGKMEPF